MVDLPARALLVDGMWVYDVKVDGNNTFVKCKACYVGRSDLQILGVNFDKGWAMCTHMESVCMTMAVTAVWKLVS